jgi:RNA polymerase sigma-70 factor (ECF subfamily)
VDDDRSLAQAALRGDRSAFDRLAERYLERTLRICLRVVGNLEDAEDAAQETFARAFARLGTFAGKSTFGTWITSIALRLCADVERARRSRRRRIAELSANFDLDRDLPSPQAHSPALRAEQRETVQNLEAALAELPPRLRAALTLRTIEGLEYDQVARALGTTVRSARLYVWEARQRLARTVGCDPRPAPRDDGGDAMSARPSARCRQARLLLPFVDGELATDDALRFEEHLAGCASCRAAVDVQRTLEEQLLALPRPRLLESDRARLLEGVARRIAAAATRADASTRPLLSLRRAAAAAALLAAAALVVAWFLRSPSEIAHLADAANDGDERGAVRRRPRPRRGRRRRGALRRHRRRRRDARRGLRGAGDQLVAAPGPRATRSRRSCAASGATRAPS